MRETSLYHLPFNYYIFLRVQHNQAKIQFSYIFALQFKRKTFDFEFMIVSPRSKANFQAPNPRPLYVVHAERIAQTLRFCSGASRVLSLHSTSLIFL